ncbi:FHAD1 protein, partial [Aleadryas rufinucha]|nr:FHAD1 protein [Aleadryas rufinucha]
QSAGVADRHAALEFSASDNSFILQDFSSPHGTFVNSCQVQNAAVRVRPGDILSFGTSGATFELLVDGAAQVGLGLPGEGCPGMSREGARARVDVMAHGRVSGQI